MNVYFNNRFLLAFILAILVPVDYVFAEIQHLFNRQGTQYTIPKGKFPKWDDMLKRWNKTQGLVDNDCQSGLFNSCYLRELETLIADIKKEPEWHKINETCYSVQPDPINILTIRPSASLSHQSLQSLGLSIT